MEKLISSKQLNIRYTKMSKSFDKKLKILNTRSNILTFNQRDALYNEKKLPIKIIRSFRKYLNMTELTKTTPYRDIINNK